jgi:hypothetical protein
MIDQNIPHNLWPEVLLAVVHITNFTATSTVEGKTLFQAFWDDIEPGAEHIPTVSHLRVLGCPVYVLIDPQKRVQSRKVAPRAELGILVGYEGYSIYRCFINSKVIRTLYVRFDEDRLVIEPNEEDAMILLLIKSNINRSRTNQDAEDFLIKA